MRKVATAILTALALVACDSAPKLDMSNAAALEQSMSEMGESLSPEERASFQQAWEAIAEAKAGEIMSGLLSENPSPVEGALLDAFKEYDGKTADEIIAAGQSLLEQKQERMRAEAATRIPELEAEIAELEAEIDQAEQEAAEARAIVEAFPQIGLSFQNARVEEELFLGPQLVYDLLVNNGSSLTVDSVSGHFVVYEDSTKAVLLEDYVSLDQYSFGSDVNLNGLAPGASITVKDLSTYATRFADVPNPYLELAFEDFTTSGTTYRSAMNSSDTYLDSLNNHLESLRNELGEYQDALNP